jgi:hypothetical protein
MRRGTLASGVIGVVLITLIAGCAGPSIGSAGTPPAALDGNLVGNWNGLFWALAGFYYPVEGTLLLQIKADGSFTVTMTPTAAANNIAKASSWSGTVNQVGRRVVFHVAKGPFPAFSSLARSGPDTLFGVANDPATGFDIGIKFERAA